MNSDDYKVLAVDDNPRTLKLLAILLPPEKFQIDYAFTGEEALKLTDKYCYDLVLLDIGMPGLDGFETCVKIHNQLKNREVPVIFLTGRADIESLKKAFQSGGVDYLTKPFNTDELMARVKTHIELKRYKDTQRRINAWLEEKITERTYEIQETNVKLELANRELQSLDLAKTEFLRMINHEIRTPLNTILGFINILKDEAKSSGLAEIISYLEISSARMEKFLMVVLQITELMTLKKSLSVEVIPIREIFDLAIGKIQTNLTSKAITLTIEGNASKFNIQGNFKLLEVCFESVLENAVQHSPDGGKIIIRIIEETPYLICDIIDTGEGFKENVLNNLFKFFTIGEQHIDQNLGLDLALVKLIMDAHKWTIEIRNNENVGATVRLKLNACLTDPAGTDQEPDEKCLDKVVNAIYPSPEHPLKTSKARRRILKNIQDSVNRSSMTELSEVSEPGSENNKDSQE